MQTAKIYKLPPPETSSDTEYQNFCWWLDNYPKRRKKGDAWKAWQQTADIRPPIEQMIAVLDTQCKSNEWQKDQGQWVPLPSSYLRAWQWDDE